MSNSCGTQQATARRSALARFPFSRWVDWLARAINEKCLRLSKLVLVAKQAWFSGHYGRTWIDHDENGLLRNGLV